MGNSTHKVDEEVLVIATTQPSTGGLRPYGAQGSKIDGEFAEKRPAHRAMEMNLKDPRIKEFYENEYLPGLEFQGYKPCRFSIRNSIA